MTTTETITFTKKRGHTWPNEEHCNDARGRRELTFPLKELAWRCCASWANQADENDRDRSLPDSPTLRDEYEILQDRVDDDWYARFGDRASDIKRKDRESFSDRLNRYAETSMTRAQLIAWFIDTNDPTTITGYAVGGRHGRKGEQQ